MVPAATCARIFAPGSNAPVLSEPSKTILPRTVSSSTGVCPPSVALFDFVKTKLLATSSAEFVTTVTSESWMFVAWLSVIFSLPSVVSTVI